MKTILATMLGLFLCMPVYGQLSPIPQYISEVWHDKVPVSGEIRTGLMFADHCEEKVKSTFFAKLPANNDFNFLNVEISSNDGHYNYTARYKLMGQGGDIELERKTKLRTELKGYRCNDLTILAWLSYDIEEEKSNFILASWEPNLSRQEAYIYVNSENPALVHVKNRITGTAKNIPCDRIEGKPNVAYNCLCRLSVSDLGKDSDISIVQRVRRSQNRYPMYILK